VIAAETGLDLARLLLDLLVVIVAAKAAAELAERIRVPAVLGEIVAGILIGPSVLGWVELTDSRGVSLSMLAEIGVLLLLLQVGMEMDLRELGKVGTASLSVAIVGVVVPFAAGFGVALAFDTSTNTAVFIGAALTATSVGITARVFGDLRALATTEARVVLGAAVADDVLGLIILTVVVKVVTGGDVDAVTILSTFGLAIGFLVVTGLLGIVGIPRLLDAVHRRAMSPATVTVVAFAITIAFAELADAAKLAFIIGAFMAGLGLGRSHHHERIARDLGAVGNILIPVFFASIGINTDLEAMFQPSVLGLAAVLSIVAVAGKLASALGMFGARVDRLLIGIGMIPRGEVGLIFASIGLANGVLDADQYGALILVMLITTVMTPPLLRWRLSGLGERTLNDPALAEPAEGWLTVDKGEVRLHGSPSASIALDLALRSALLSRYARPSSALVDWFGANRRVDLEWSVTATSLLINVLRDDNPRAWRLLDTTGVLERALPEVAAAMRRRRADISDLDPTITARFPVVERLDAIAVQYGFASDDVLLAAFVADVSADTAEPRQAARLLAARLAPTEEAARIVALVDDARMLRTGIQRADSFDGAEILHLADHFGTGGHTRDAHELATALGPLRTWQREALDERIALIVDALDHPDLSSERAASLGGARRAAARAILDDPAQLARVDSAPSSYVLSHSPEELARHARLLEPPTRPGEVRVDVHSTDEPNSWVVEVACCDMEGLLVRLVGVLTDAGIGIVRATIATWDDGSALDTFVVSADHTPDALLLSRTFSASLSSPFHETVLDGLTIQFDNDSLPKHTSASVSGADRQGVLRAIASAFTSAGVVVHHAHVSSTNGLAYGRFTLSSKRGEKLDTSAMNRVQWALGGRPSRLRRLMTPGRRH